MIEPVRFYHKSMYGDFKWRLGSPVQDKKRMGIVVVARYTKFLKKGGRLQ